MNTHSDLKASVLATVLVVATLILLSVWGILALWRVDSRLYARLNYERNQRAHLESAFNLYEHRGTDAWEELPEGGYTIRLYDSIPESQVYLQSKPWGLYRIVTVSNYNHRQQALRLMGAESPWKESCVLYYSNRNLPLTVSGKSYFKGEVRLPKNGLQYGQFESRFFEGEKLSPAQIQSSNDSLPTPLASARAIIDSLWKIGEDPQIDPLEHDSLSVSFTDAASCIVSLGSGTLTHCTLRGQLILTGDDLHIDSTCQINHPLIIARSVTLGPGFRGSLQIFATDSVRVGERVLLQDPSGIFLDKTDDSQQVVLAPHSEVNGYVIVNDRRPISARSDTPINYCQAPSARVRGLVYIDGTAQWQGSVSGSVFLQRACYVSPFSQYQDFIYQATVLENRAMAYPCWLETPSTLKSITWTH